MSRPLRAHARLLALPVVVLALLLAQLATAPTASARLWKPSVTPSANPLVDLVEYQDRVLVAVNRKRKKAGLPKVRYFETCPDLLADAWAVKLALLGDLVHRDQQVVLDRCGYSWAGEALVSGTDLSPKAAVKAWMASPTHRAVLMKRRADRAGIGTALGLDGKIYTVLNFGDAS